MDHLAAVDSAGDLDEPDTLMSAVLCTTPLQSAMAPGLRKVWSSFHARAWHVEMGRWFVMFGLKFAGLEFEQPGCSCRVCISGRYMMYVEAQDRHSARQDEGETHLVKCLC